jgi:hypothetical protein
MTVVFVVVGVIIFAVLIAFVFILTPPQPNTQGFQNLSNEVIGGASAGILALGAIIFLIYVTLQHQTAAALRKYGL